MHHREDKQLILVCLLGSAVLMFGGKVYRMQHLDEAVTSSVLQMDIKSSVPVQIADWEGSEINIPELAESDYFADQALIRRYRQDGKPRFFDLYIACSVTAGRMLGHKPEVCYKAGGWILEESREHEVVISPDRFLPCTVNLFRQPSDGGKVAVLSFYIFDGGICKSEESFSGLKWRMRSTSPVKDPSVTQIQISAPYESVAVEGVQLLGDVLLEAFGANQR